MDVSRKAARGLSASALVKGFSPQALHMYTDEADQVQHARGRRARPSADIKRILKGEGK